MVFSKLALLAGAVGVAAHVAQSPLGSVDAVDTTSECRLPPAIDPRNIYRFTPTAPGAVKNIHTIDERADMHEHIKMLAFYYDLIRNFDGAELKGEAAVAVAEDNEEL
ncbi:hypothetical protein NHJ13051_009488 [Beauveria bassiana]